VQRLVKLIRLNNLQYNANRDPQAYRRTPGEPFRLQALLVGTGTATARFEAEGRTLCEQRVPLPGTFECSFRFETPGSRVGTLSVEANGARFTQELRLDVDEHAWVG
jgi:hypothetical protein